MGKVASSGSSGPRDTALPARDALQDTAYEVAIIEDHDFGSIHLAISLDRFVELGFNLGDSVDIVLSNGFALENIPCYDGYYARNGEVVVCGYPGYEYLAVAITQGDSIWELSGAEAGMTAIVSLHEKGAYLSVQEAFSLVYSNERSDFSSDEQFANFRALTGGNIVANRFFRSASPCDNKYNRAPYVDALAERVGIAFIINLSDDEEEVAAFIEESGFRPPYFSKLLERGDVALLGLTVNFGAVSFSKGVGEALLKSVEYEGPVLVHCIEGKDRTGFICQILLVLAGASEDEIIDDYMITYDNFYGVNEESDKETYDDVVELKAMANLDLLKSLSDAGDLLDGTREYLRFGGLTVDEIDRIVDSITN